MVVTNGITKSFTADLTWHASGNGGVVAAGPHVSAQAGIDILSRGGNAIDSAVAIIFNLAVSDYGSFSIGGEVPLIFYSAGTAKVIVFNGMGSVPGDQKAIDWYYANGIPGSGIRSATVPSAVSTCLTALELKGTMAFEQVISSTLELLDRGGESWYTNLAETFRKLIYTEKNTPGNDYVEYGKMPIDAITAPRFRTYHTENSFVPSPHVNERIFKIGALDIDSGDSELIVQLANRGHNVIIASELIGKSR